jgi:hypothetical protein
MTREVCVLIYIVVCVVWVIWNGESSAVKRKQWSSRLENDRNCDRERPNRVRSVNMRAG